jgi:predicted DNA-binding protein
MKLDRNESINFTLRMPVEQRLQLERIAKNEKRTVTNLINMVLGTYIEEYNTQKK